MDNMETQPMGSPTVTDPDLVSPIRMMQSLSLESPNPNLQAKKVEETDDHLDEESAEEESATDDDEVDVVGTIKVHDNLCIDIESDEETILSPQKAKPADLVVSAGSDGVEPAREVEPAKHSADLPSQELPAGSGDLKKTDIATEEPAEVEEILDSDEDKEASKRGAFKVGALAHNGKKNKWVMIDDMNLDQNIFWKTESVIPCLKKWDVSACRVHEKWINIQWTNNELIDHYYRCMIGACYIVYSLFMGYHLTLPAFRTESPW